jgi:ribonuclease R
LIEEMMLAANVAVAKFLAESEIPAVYRIHEPPNADAIALLERYLANFGSRINVNQGKLQKRLTRALQEFEGKPEAQILNILALRSMSQAKYSADNVGHFGLGFEYYTHFTSPIRRYPDLIVHRLLKSRIMKSSIYQSIAEDDLQTAATMLSACEQRSVKAERQFQAIKKARFMQKFIGEEFEGIISSVTKFGVFVLLRQYEVDGLIRAENLSKEKLEFDEDNLVLVGKRSGMRFAIGDLLTIRVDAADAEAGQVDFGLAAIGDQRSDMADVIAERRTRKETKGPRRNQKVAAKEARGGRGGKAREREETKGRGRDRDRARERGRDRDQERPGKSLKKPTKPIQPVQTASKSRKAQVLDRMEEKVFEILAEANTESEGRGQKFDPEKHLQQALKKWKERNKDAPPARIGSSSQSRISGRQERDEERTEKTPAKETFFSKFKNRNKEESDRGGGGKKKSSSKRGKGR